MIADVAGHHLGAALTMASVRSIVRAEMLYGQYPIGTVMEYLNAQLYADLARAEQFVSAILVQYDAAARRLQYCIAGHPAPLLLRNGRLRELSSDSGGVLGLTAHDTFPAIEHPLQKNDLLFFYTDGLVGVSDRRGKNFGLARLRRLLTRASSHTARQLIAQVRADIAHFAQGHPFADDVTMMAWRIK